ncbi:acyltransferase family protein [Maribellus comscasis]|uniref:Acyltransferase family protein n=1 Tax=Maribellus comscasis TaxID=2681766 RepID=A0A6I6JWA8_9BACT|nr:acyltransferase family protein [Maribellus comscasis]QGY44387.1 acyltransferase family protein [Maribellus comscasis]
MKRLALPDLLKGFAVFLIVPVHILELFIDYPGRESLFGKTVLFLGGPVAVPVFMIVMGYFIARNKKPLAKNLLRGIKVFALGILLNIGLNFHLLLKIKFAGWQINPREYIWGVDILYLAGLSIIFLSFLKPVKNNRGLISLVLVFLITGITGFLNKEFMTTERNYILPFIAGTFSWSYFPLFPWLAYPFLGFAFYHFEEKIVQFLNKQKWISAFILTGVAALILFFSEWGIKNTIDLSAYYHHTFLFSLWTFGIVILWSLFLRFIIQKNSKSGLVVFLRWLGKNITLFYLIQWLIIGNIATAIYQTQPINRYVFWFAGIFSVTVLLTWLFEKTNIKPAR